MFKQTLFCKGKSCFLSSNWTKQ